MISQGLIFRKNPLYEKCPSCSSLSTLRKSSARILRETIIKNFSFWGIYRCKKCGWRGYKSRFLLTTQSLKNGFIYIIIIAIAALIIYEILKRFV